jgi:hypothetical protein
MANYLCLTIFVLFLAHLFVIRLSKNPVNIVDNLRYFKVIKTGMLFSKVQMYNRNFGYGYSKPVILAEKPVWVLNLWLFFWHLI